MSNTAQMSAVEMRLEDMNFDGDLLTGDSYVFIEIGDLHKGEGFRLANLRDWMRINYHR